MITNKEHALINKLKESDIQNTLFILHIYTSMWTEIMQIYLISCTDIFLTFFFAFQEKGHSV